MSVLKLLESTTVAPEAAEAAAATEVGTAAAWGTPAAAAAAAEAAVTMLKLGAAATVVPGGRTDRFTPPIRRVEGAVAEGEEDVEGAT